MKTCFVMLLLALALLGIMGCQPTPLKEYESKAQVSDYVLLQDIVSQYGMTQEYDIATRRYTIKHPDLTYSVIPGIAYISVNGKIIRLETPVIADGSRILVPYKFPELAYVSRPEKKAVEIKVRPVRGRNIPVPGKGNVVEPLRVRPVPVVKNDFRSVIHRIVIDPGHGGKDPGAFCAGLSEKEVNLDIALKVAEILKNAGFEVVMTRSKDIFLELEKRGDIANKHMPDLFVSIHANAAANTSASGFELFYLRGDALKAAEARKFIPVTKTNIFSTDGGPFVGDGMNRFLYDLLLSENRREGIILAGDVRSALSNYVTTPDRGVKSKSLRVLRDAIAPAILIEVGFISNPGERRQLASGDYRSGVARAIADGIIKYKKDYESFYK